MRSVLIPLLVTTIFFLSVGLACTVFIHHIGASDDLKIVLYLGAGIWLGYLNPKIYTITKWKLEE